MLTEELCEVLVDVVADGTWQLRLSTWAGRLQCALSIHCGDMVEEQLKERWEGRGHEVWCLTEDATQWVICWIVTPCDKAGVDRGIMGFTEGNDLPKYLIDLGDVAAKVLPCPTDTSIISIDKNMGPCGEMMEEVLNKQFEANGFGPGDVVYLPMPVVFAYTKCPAHLR